MFRVFVLFCCVGVALAGSGTVPMRGEFMLSNDCPVNSQVEVTGSLNITGSRMSTACCPKLSAAGRTDIFVKAGGHLVFRNLNLTGGNVSAAEESGGSPKQMEERSQCSIRC